MSSRRAFSVQYDDYDDDDDDDDAIRLIKKLSDQLKNLHQTE